MDTYTTFFSYFFTVSRRIWWRAWLLSILVWLPWTVGSAYLSAFYIEAPAAAMPATPTWEDFSPFVIPTLGAIGVGTFYDLFLWTPAIIALLLLTRDSEAARREELYAATGLTPHGELRAAGPWRPDWAGIWKETLSLYVPMLILRLLITPLVWISCMACCLPGLYIMTKIMVSPALVVLERETGVGAFQRGWRMTDGIFWQMLFLLVLFFLVAIAFTLPFAVLWGVLGFFFPVIVEPNFWFVNCLTEIPSNAVSAAAIIFAYCLYKYLRAWEESPSPQAALDFLYEEKDGPRHRPLPDDDHGYPRETP